MSDQYIGEIRMFAGDAPPVGWALCNGEIIKISSFPSLFSVIGKTYGGDGIATFALPDFRGRLPVHFGDQKDLTSRTLGQIDGTEKETITQETMPPHDHHFCATEELAFQHTLDGNVLASTGENTFYSPPTDDKQVNLIPASVLPSGNDLPHSNLMPYLCINFIIAYKGTLPEKN